MPRFARKPLLVSVISLSIASVIVVLCYISPGTYQHLHRIISTNLFLHLLFNSIIIVIVAKEHFGDSRNELDKGFPLFHFAYEMEEHGGKIGSDDEDGDHIDDLKGGADQVNDGGHDNDDDDYDDDDDDDYYHGSDGYNEDDDDNGSYAEMGWEDEEEEEEYDSELEKRVEAFIAKVINGWREEWFSDNMQD